MKRWKSLIVIFAVFVVYKGEQTQGERTQDECVIRANEPDTTSANPLENFKVSNIMCLLNSYHTVHFSKFFCRKYQR